MTISASRVMELRAATGAGMMDCKKALQEVSGDMEAAKDYLRKKGISIARKKSDRATHEGGIAIRLSEDGKTGAMVQLACETDFVARNEQFGALLNALGDQVLAGGADDLQNQTLRDGQGTVGDLITDSIGKLGENLQLVEATRLALSGEGTVGGYVHSNRKIGVLVALGCDRRTSGGELESLARDLAMHIAAMQVSAVSQEQIDPAELEKEREIFTAQARESGKPAGIVEKMVQGRMKKFIKEVTLLDQPFVKEPDTTVGDLVAQAGRNLATALSVERFVKFQF